MMNNDINEDNRDRLIDVLLSEKLGQKPPPDVAEKVLARAFPPAEESGAEARGGLPRRRWAPRLIIAAAAAAALAGVFAIAWFSRKDAAPGKTEVAKTVPQPPEPVKVIEVTPGKSYRIVTSAEASTVALPGPRFIHLTEPRTEVWISAGEKEDRVALETGGVRCKVDAGAKPLAVDAAEGTVRAAAGAEFNAKIEEPKEGDGAMTSKRLSVKVLAGAVFVASAWGPQSTLNAGEAAAVGGEKPPVVAAKMDARPIGKLTADEMKTPQAKNAALTKGVTEGALRVAKSDGSLVECPLRHTDVQADVSGFIARVKVTQTFHNPLDENIEAVYVFPLPHQSAVDCMTMVIGERRIVGLIKRKEEARRIYQRAIEQDKTAALLEQERPNVFVQSVGNIRPGQEIKIEISYVDVLEYDQGVYEFHFPMVVGPRYNPAGTTEGIGAAPAGQAGGSGQRTEVQYLPPGTRNGHDISLALKVDAGVLIRDLKVVNHEAGVKSAGSKATVALSRADSIPNKDFVFRYKVVGEKPEMAALFHANGSGQGEFMLMIQPGEMDELKASPPREMTFLVDVSGSMRGAPTEMVKEAMKNFLALCRKEDTVQVITFESNFHKLFDKHLPVTPENIQKALNFMQGQRGSGGTEMMKGIRAAIDEPLDAERVRMVILLSDGYIGNEAQIIEAVGKGCGDQIKFWALGIGTSVNRFLFDGIARQGGGMGKVLSLREDSTAVVREFMTRIQRAQLSKIHMDWGGANVTETYPVKIPELWLGRPVILFGRFDGAEGRPAKVKVSGMAEGKPVEWYLDVAFPVDEPANDSLGAIWARRKIEDLMQQTYYKGSPEVAEEVTRIALEYSLMSQYTSFVAVDESDAHRDEHVARAPVRMNVPVPMPEGVSWEGVFGETERGNVAYGMPPGKFKESFATRDDRQAGVQTETRKVAGDRKDATWEYVVRKEGLSLAEAAGLMDERNTRTELYNSADKPFREEERLRPPPDSDPTTTEPVPGLDPDRFKKELTTPGYYTRHPKTPSVGPELPKTAPPEKVTVAPGPELGPPVRGQSLDAVMTIPGEGAGRGWNDAGTVGIFGVGAAAENEQTVKIYTAFIDYDSTKSYQRMRSHWGYMLLDGDKLSADLTKRAEEALKAGDELKKKADLLLAARAEYTFAYITGMAAGSQEGYKTSEAALAAIGGIDADLVKLWAKNAPALDRKLDIVMRNRTLDEALADIGRAAGLKATIEPGAVEDARALLNREHVDATWLDLRGATTAQALDWLLTPNRLTWAIENGEIRARSARRGPGMSAWVYDVSMLALPTEAELRMALKAAVDAAAKAAKPGEKPAGVDAAQALAEFTARELDWFLAEMREQTGVDAKRIAWTGPGMLLIYGDAEVHKKAAKALDMTRMKWASAARSFITKAAARHDARHEAHDKRIMDMEKARVHAALANNGFRLMAAAAKGERDEEALAELAGALKRPEISEVLKEGDYRAMRGLWAISESARAMPKDAELAALARGLYGNAIDAVDASLAALDKNPEDAAAWWRALYAALIDEGYIDSYKARHHHDAIRQRLIKGGSETSPLKAARIVAAALLAAPGEKTDAAALKDLIEKTPGQVAGEDMVVLTALACRRAGGDAWEAFRGAQQEIAGKQGISGAAVVLINSIERAKTVRAGK
jgi:Ca-activated chloride channel homolog